MSFSDWCLDTEMVALKLKDGGKPVNGKSHKPSIGAA